MTKISLYKFITTFCLVPTTDLAAVAQRALGILQRTLIISGLIKLVSFAFNVLSTPFYVAGLVALLTWSPDTVAWIFIKLGEIQMRVFLIVLNVAMPDIFQTAEGDFSSWADIWQEGLNLLPVEMVEIINGLGLAEIIGLVTGTIGSVWVIKIYRKVMLRAGLW